MKKGKIIVIEGACDGIGKTTQYNMLCERISKSGVICTSHHFPSYNTYQGAPVMEYLKGTYGLPNKISPYFVDSLYANDRAITWYTNLKKLYEQGNTIILDRYTTSSLIYQSALIEDKKEKEEFIDYVMDYEYNKLGIGKPDCVIFLYAPFDLVTEIRNKRKQNEGISNDIHESNIEFMKKVYENAMFVADYLSFNKVKCNDNDKMRSIEDIHEEVYSLVKKI